MSRRIFCVWILVGLLVTALTPSVDAQRRGRGNGKLPGALGSVPRNKMQALDQLLDDTMLYLSNKYDTRGLDVGNFFGKVLLKPPADDAIDATPPEPGQFGLYVLGSLNNAQIRVLSNLARKQVSAVAAYQAKQKQVMTKFQEMQKLDRPSRALEREIQALGKEMGTAEALMGLEQATTFLQVHGTLTDAQKEYLMLLRRSPDAGSLDNPNVIKIRSLADKLDARHRAMVMAVAERCCMFLTSTAAQNVPTLSRRPMTEKDTEEAEKKMAFLQTLSLAQQTGLVTLLGVHSRAAGDAQNRRLQIAAMFDTLKANKHLDERKLAAPGAALGQADVTLFIGKLRGLDQLKKSLSDAQRAFISSNILVGQP